MEDMLNECNTITTSVPTFRPAVDPPTPAKELELKKYIWLQFQIANHCPQFGLRVQYLNND